MILSGSAGQYSPARFIVVCGCLLAMVHWGCGGGGGGGTSSALQISLTATPPPAGQADVVWLADGGLDGSMQIVEVVGRGIDTAFDRYDLEITFDPFVVRAVSMTSGFLLTGCAGPSEVTAHNVTGGSSGSDANATGHILFSTSLPSGVSGCPLPATGTLARIVFFPQNAGSSMLEFLPCDDMDPADLKGSCMTASDPAVNDPDVQFLNAGAMLVTSE